MSDGGRLIGMQELQEGYNHSERITLFVERLLQEAGLQPGHLEAVCVSGGPGSYTGLRIGVSVAKGICYALGIPLLSVSTLDALARGAVMSGLPETDTPAGELLLCPMLDARRLEVYTALYNREGLRISPIEALIIDPESFAPLLLNHPVLFFGNGAAKCKSLITGPGALFLDGIHASARFMSYLAEEKYNKGETVDVSYFEPFYLKDFVATVPVNKVIPIGNDQT